MGSTLMAQFKAVAYFTRNGSECCTLGRESMVALDESFAKFFPKFGWVSGDEKFRRKLGGFQRNLEGRPFSRNFALRFGF